MNPVVPDTLPLAHLIPPTLRVELELATIAARRAPPTVLATQHLDADHVRAETVLADVPEHAKRAAAKGLDHAAIMYFDSDGFTRPPNYNGSWSSIKPEWLKGTAKIVYDHCYGLGLNPRIVAHYLISDRTFGFDIVIHW